MAIRVAIVDDHRLVREGLTRLLEAEDDLEVVGACACGEDVEELVGASRPDVLLLDIALPGVDGLSLIGAVRASFPETRILVLSMHSEADYAAAAAERGAAGLVGKASSSDVLVGAIRAVAAGAAIPIDGALTAREREILAQIAAGRSNEQIGDALAISVKTVEGHCERLMDKLDIHTRAGLVAYGHRVELP